jgi:hypothetical protein
MANKPVPNVGGSNSVVTPVRRDRLRLVLLAICAAISSDSRRARSCASRVAPDAREGSFIGKRRGSR